MPDVLMWIDQSDESMLRIDDIPEEFDIGLQEVVANAMQLPREPLTAEKIDFLDIRPLRRSATKKVAVRVYPDDNWRRIRDMDDRLREIGQFVKNWFGLPEDQMCVAVSAGPVGYKCWVKV